MSAAKNVWYDRLAEELAALLASERDLIANAANTAALLYQRLDSVNWVGFYFRRNGELVLGPFQGRPACVRIPLGTGVCGAAASRRGTIVVEDVRNFPGHIACDAASNAEIAVPLIVEGALVGVLDIDSPTRGRFDEGDRQGLERIVGLFLRSTEMTLT
ncbi:MAG: GAF domain-containing protein [Pirellulaceae bacterium]